MAELEKTAPVNPFSCTMPEMLEGVPLHLERRIDRMFSLVGNDTIHFPPSIRMHCDDVNCEGIRRHSKIQEDFFPSVPLHSYHFVVYQCENCKISLKVFCFKAKRDISNSTSGVCTKIYQEPPFGQPIPKRLFQVIGEANREYFLQARRAIARGLGIGAYAYYRRIVENTKFDLVGSVLEVAQATNAAPPQLELLKKAQAERQFSKAIEILRDVSAIPAVLLIDGHNPLALLHDTLSEGIHELSDKECLERAQEAEIVLCELATRMQQAVTEHKSVKSAISNILKRKGEQSQPA